jgi:hypothetical protein
MARIRSDKFQLAVATTACWSCGEPTLAVALVAPPGSTATDDDDGPADAEEIYEPIALSGVTLVPYELQAKARAVAPTFYPDNSRTLGVTYWMNHCQQCGKKIGDHYLHREPEGPFFSTHRYDDGDGRRTDLCGGEIVCTMPYLAPSPARPRKTDRHR